MDAPAEASQCAKLEAYNIQVRGAPTMKPSVISVDLAKNVFQVCALNQAHKVISNRKVKRAGLMDAIRQFEPTTVAIEACYSANFWAREFEALGHKVVLIPAAKVKPFVQGNKNDANDVLAIAEAYFRPNMHFVTPKTLAQQDVQSLQRIRQRHIKNRTALTNQIRGLLAEYGVTVSKGVSKMSKALPGIIEDKDNMLTSIAKSFLTDLQHELYLVTDNIKHYDETILNVLVEDRDYQRLRGIHGVGPVTAATVIATIGNGKQFKNGRAFAAWVGLTPKQHSSGDTERMGGMTKRGNRDLRELFIHGARSQIRARDKQANSHNYWLQSLMETKPTNKAVVAAANKLARITWAVLTSGLEYQAGKRAHAC